MKQDKLIELCPKCLAEYEAGLAFTNMKLEKKAFGIIKCGQCGRTGFGSSYRIRRIQDDGRGTEKAL